MTSVADKYCVGLLKQTKEEGYMSDKIKVYFAAPLFTKAEQAYNEGVYWGLKTELLGTEFGNKVEIFFPQEQPINDKSDYADSKMIAKMDAQAVEESDILVALLDGPVIDPGVASEIGIAYALGKPILGLYTDIRRLGADNEDKIAALGEVAENQFHYLNLFTTGLIKLGGGKIYTDEKGLARGLLNTLRRGGSNG